MARIAEALACHPSTVYQLYQAYQREGEQVLHRKQSPGQPQKVTPKQEQALTKAIAQPPRTAAKLAVYLGLTVHAVTVLRYLWALNWRWRRPKLRVASPDPRHVAKRRYLQTLVRQARRGQVICISWMKWTWPGCPRSVAAGCASASNVKLTHPDKTRKNTSWAPCMP